MGGASCCEKPAGFAVEEALGPLRFWYFRLWAKGPSIALALEISGLDWEGKPIEVDDWPTAKQMTPWLEVPVLEIPGKGMIGHEATILNYIGFRKPEMAGVSVDDYLASQQLMHEGEDIFKALYKIADGTFTTEMAEAFWDTKNMEAHNSQFGVHIYSGLL